MAMKVNEVLQQMLKAGISDIHFKAGSPPLLRVHGNLTPTEFDSLNASAVEELALSLMNEDQKAQVQTIMKEQRAAAQEARKNNASKDDMRALRQKTHDRMAGVLNSEQMQKFEAKAKKAHKRRRAQG